MYARSAEVRVFWSGWAGTEVGRYYPYCAAGLSCLCLQQREGGTPLKYLLKNTVHNRHCTTGMIVIASFLKNIKVNHLRGFGCFTFIVVQNQKHFFKERRGWKDGEKEVGCGEIRETGS